MTFNAHNLLADAIIPSMNIGDPKFQFRTHPTLVDQSDVLIRYGYDRDEFIGIMPRLLAFRIPGVLLYLDEL